MNFPNRLWPPPPHFWKIFSYMTPDTLQYVISSNLSVLLFGLCQLLGELLESWKRLRGFLNTQDTTYCINHSYFIYYTWQREVERFIRHIAHRRFSKNTMYLIKAALAGCLCTSRGTWSSQAFWQFLQIDWFTLFRYTVVHHPVVIDCCLFHLLVTGQDEAWL